MRSPLWLAKVSGWYRHLCRPEGPLRGYLKRGGDFYLATSGDIKLATSGDFYMAMDSLGAGSMPLARRSLRTVVAPTIDPELPQLTLDP